MSTLPFDATTQPIERLAARCGQGEIDLATAHRIAAQPGFAANLDAEHTAMLCAAVRELTNRRDHRSATLIGELLVIALANRGDDAAMLAMRDDAELTWVRAVTASLGADPDWRRYASACAAGARVLQRAEARQDGVMIAGAHEELAGLHLHPLQTHYSGDAGWRAVADDWYRRGDAAAGSGPDAPSPYPPPEAAFERARDHSTIWAACVEGHGRGSALYSEVTALEWVARARDEEPNAETMELAGQALALLDPAQDLPALTHLMALRQSAGLPPDTDALIAACQVPVDDLIERFGPHNTVNTLLNIIYLLRPIDPTLALAMAERAAPAVTAANDAGVLARHSQALLGALVDQMREGAADPGGPIKQAAEQLVATAQAEGWAMPRVAGALLMLVQRAPQSNAQAQALALFNAARRVCEEVFNAYPAAFRFWEMTLASGGAVNAANRGDWASAVAGYAGALKAALPLGFADFSQHQLRRLVHAGQQCSGDDLNALLAILFEMGLDIETRLGSEGTRQLQSLAAHVTAQQLAGGTVNANVLHFTWQIAKARRFGAALRTRAVQRLVNDPSDAAVLARIRELAQQVPLADQASAPGSRIARDRRLLAFVRDALPAAGETPLEQLANLQQRYDRQLELRLALLANQREAHIVSFEALREQVGPRTALLQLFIAEWQERRAIVALLTSATATFVSVATDDDMPMRELREGTRSEHAYSYEEDVYLLREAVLSEAIDDAQLARFFHAAGGAFLHGSLGDGLDALRAAGCDQLVVVPHGPFHYAPLHLFEHKGRLLADDWCVTVLPGIELLRQADAAAPRRVGGAAFGLGFRGINLHGLPALDEAVDEAQRVALVLGTPATVDAAATQSALFDALCQARHVHLATHGALNLDAPAFQMLVLAPEDGSDGLVHAHELLPLDMAGLELVTLSACETALGRLDRADNPRGLPAALLLAGAQTVIGSLWPVASDASRAFFVALYEALAAGATRGDAFRAAQQEVRRRFTQPRDWAAFYLLGDWR